MPAKPLPEQDLRHVLDLAAPVFEALDGARVLLTGGTGFFGVWLVESALFAATELSLNLQLDLLTRNPDGFASKFPHLVQDSRVALIVGDVRSFGYPGECSHIIHAATDASAQLNNERPVEMFDVILEGTRRVVEVMKTAKPEKVLYLSSGAVYGVQPLSMERVPETFAGAPDCLDPKAAYGNAKRAAEWLITAGSGTMGHGEVTVARPFAFVGPHLPLDTHFAAGNFLGNALRGEPIRISGDGTPLRSYQYAADLAVWLWTILIKGKPGRAYNVGSPQAVSIRELAECTARVAGGIPVEVAKEAVPGVRPARYVPDTSRAEDELGLRPELSLEEGIRRTLIWLKAGRT